MCLLLATFLGGDPLGVFVLGRDLLRSGPADRDNHRGSSLNQGAVRGVVVVGGHRGGDLDLHSRRSAAHGFFDLLDVSWEHRARVVAAVRVRAEDQTSGQVARRTEYCRHLCLCRGRARRSGLEAIGTGSAARAASARWLRGPAPIHQMSRLRLREKITFCAATLFFL